MVFGFVLPAVLLVGLAWSEKASYLGARFVALAGNSFLVAGLTAAIAVVLATLMAYAARLTQSRVVELANRAASLGYAIPGAVVAVGVLVPLGRLDNALADWIESVLG